jgi:hypothetical protein
MYRWRPDTRTDSNNEIATDNDTFINNNNDNVIKSNDATVNSAFQQQFKEYVVYRFELSNSCILYGYLFFESNTLINIFDTIQASPMRKPKN